MGHELSVPVLRSNQWVGIINGWGNAQKSLLEQQEREREKLLRNRAALEASASVYILGQATTLGASRLNDNFYRLQKLENGIYENGVCLSLKHYFDVAQELKVINAETYVNSIFSSFQEITHSKDVIILNRVFALEKDSDKNIFGSLHLAINKENSPLHIRFSFEAPNSKYPNLDSVKLYRDISLHDSFEDNFDQLILSEKASVVAALFVATDRAVIEALDNYSEQS